MIATWKAREQKTVSTSAVGITASNVDTETIYAEIQVQAYQVRVTFDGATAPVAATTGTLWNPGDIKRIWGGENVKNLQFIREVSNDATLVVNYWGRG